MARKSKNIRTVKTKKFSSLVEQVKANWSDDTKALYAQAGLFFSEESKKLDNDESLRTHDSI